MFILSIGIHSSNRVGFPLELTKNEEGKCLTRSRISPLESIDNLQKKSAEFLLLITGRWNSIGFFLSDN